LYLLSSAASQRIHKSCVHIFCIIDLRLYVECKMQIHAFFERLSRGFNDYITENNNILSVNVGVVIVNITTYMFIVYVFNVYTRNKVQFVSCTTAIKRGGGDYPELFLLFLCVCAVGGSAKRNGFGRSVGPMRAALDAVASRRCRRNLRHRPAREMDSSWRGVR